MNATELNSQTALEQERKRRRIAESLVNQKQQQVLELQEEIQRLNEQMDKKVAARMQELGNSNKRLLEEIKERERLERSLRESELTETRLSLVASKTSNGVIITDDKWRIEWVNEGFERLSGFSQKEIVGKTPESFLAGPETSAQTIENLRKQLKSQQGYSAEILCYGKTKQPYWIHMDVHPIRDSAGILTNFMAIQTDITRRRQAEQFIRESEDRFRNLADSVPSLIWVSDAKGGCVYFNKPWLDYTGKSLKEQIGNGWLTSLHPEDRVSYAKAYRHAHLQKKNFQIKYRLRQANGSYRWFLCTGVPRTTDDGQFAGYLGSAMDITEQLALANELGVVSSRLKAIVDSAVQFAIISTDTQGLIRVFNAGAEKMLGYAAKEVIGIHSPQILHLRSEVEQYGKELSTQLNRSIEGFEVFTAKANLTGIDERDWTYVCKNGNRLQVHLVVTTIRNANGEITGFLGVARNITQERQAERALQRAKDQAESANRAKSEFLANMSHELRTPLGAILGFTEMLNNESLPQVERKKAIQFIQSSGEHLLAVINDILDLSKIEANRMEFESLNCSPWKIFREVFQTLKPRAEQKKLDFTIEPSGVLPRSIQSDPTRLRQILVNLVGNAIKFTVANKKVQMRLYCRFEDSKPHAICFEVKDQGTGISKDQVANIFVPFLQGDASTTRKFGGTGLGLSISKRLAEALGGTVEVSSEFAVGSTFTLCLPIAKNRSNEWIQSTQLQGSPSAQSVCSQTLQRKLIGKILLVEDTPENQMVIRYHLKNAGLDVEIAGDGKEGMEKALQGHFDLILMDMQMPEMDGYTATRQLRDQQFLKPIIALTAHAMCGDREKCLAAGCTEYVTKPVDSRKLIDVIARLLRNNKEESLPEFFMPTAEPTPTTHDPEFRRLVSEYRRALGERLGDISAAFDSSNFSGLKVMFHQMKGSAGLYGYAGISEAAGLLESAIADKLDRESLKELIDEFDKYVRTVISSS